MNRTAIRNFAVYARKKLIDGIKQKAYEIGITESEIKEPEIISSDTVRINNIYLKKYEVSQRKRLIENIRDRGYEQVIEEAAYIWFNRFIAIRFMEVNGYLPTGVRVLSSSDHGRWEPDIIKEALNIDLDIDKEVVYNLQDNNDAEGLFKYLLIRQCNALHDIMPVVFQEIADYTEILLPDHLLQEGSVIREIVTGIEEEDWREQVEIIGWLYQYYISEKKDEVFEGLKKNIKITKENIPAATQLFTPDWIVKYMVENSLGRLWLESHPEEELKVKWKYYSEEAKQDAEVKNKLQEIRTKNRIESPEDIRFLDPCMGSGHILVYAYDVLYDIYKSEGYSERDIPKLILEKNLYGLDIDDRAAQLAYFAVMMKARSKNKRIFRENIKLNLSSIAESNGLSEEVPGFFENHKEDVEYLIDVFYDAKEYGSILDVKNIDYGSLEKVLDQIKDKDTSDIFELQQRNIILERLPALIKQGSIMSRKYNVVCTNPPYMGSKGMDKELTGYLKANYPKTNKDMSTVFMEKGLKYLLQNGYLAMINIPSWMFLSAYEDFRRILIESVMFTNMIHLGRGIFGSDFGTVSFVMNNSHTPGFKGKYKRLYQKQGAVDSIEQKEEWFFSAESYVLNQEMFLMVPGYAIAYWATESMYELFAKNPPIENFAYLQPGLQTSNNDMFLRLWHEIDISKFDSHSGSSQEAKEKGFKWFPYNKGGDFRKWYGNRDYVVNWLNDGEEIKTYVNKKYPYLKGNIDYVIKDRGYYFKEAITWSFISSSKFGVRYSPSGCLFDVGGSSLFPPEDMMMYVLGFLGSSVAFELIMMENPTMNFQVGNIAKLPLLLGDDETKDKVDKLVSECIHISKNDWDSFETSWEFKTHPIIRCKGNCKTIAGAFDTFKDAAKMQFNTLKKNEEELNRLFMEIYDIETGISPEVEDRDITISKADRERDIKSFISYAVGCMFGRYSLDEEGLIYGGGEFDRDRYKSFKVSYDNVIPVLDDDYFEDDITNRFVDFVNIIFGEDALEENLDYIAKTLGRKAAETSRQAIRRYFIKDFYKDHVRVYQKRPIYWLFDSGKNDGFKALIYMHRYNEGTVAAVRTDYLHKLQKKYEAESSRLDIVINSDVSEREKAAARKRREKIDKQMQECIQYDQVIAHVANQKIEINPDDGIKNNYEKFQDIGILLGEGRKPLKADLLAKM